MATKVNDFKVGDWVVFTNSALDHHTPFSGPPFDGAMRVTGVSHGATYPIMVSNVPLEYNEIRLAEKNEIPKTNKKLKSWIITRG